MYLLDTNVISEARKRQRAHPGVLAFFAQAVRQRQALYLSAVTVGELHRGVALIRHRGDTAQATLLAAWLAEVMDQFGSSILPLDTDAAVLWGRLRVPDPAHEIDKQIAAVALLHGLTVVTRNTADFAGTGVGLLNPFASA